MDNCVEINEKLEMDSWKDFIAQWKILITACKIEPGGCLVSLKDLRLKHPDIPKEQFDKHIMNLAESGQVFLHKHVGTAIEKTKVIETLIKSGKNYYMGLVVRNYFEIIKTIERIEI